MTRPALSLRQAALIVAGGSFLCGAAATSALADEGNAAARAEALTAPLPFGGARLNIAPLRLEFDAGKQAATVTLTNTSGRDVAVQSRLFAWSQEAGEDRFAPSSALTISPSIISIPPGATQVVRLLRSGAASPGEKRFRLAVDQLPDPASAQSGSAEARLRFTLPVFLDRDTAAPARLEWSVRGGELALANAGGATARVLAVQVKDAAGAPVALERNSLRYVLGGAAITWPLANACSLGPVTITAEVDGQTAHGTATPSC
ncbi:MAG: molecular chaperone [Cypionkella sp.]